MRLAFLIVFISLFLSGCLGNNFNKTTTYSYKPSIQDTSNEDKEIKRASLNDKALKQKEQKEHNDALVKTKRKEAKNIKAIKEKEQNFIEQKLLSGELKSEFKMGKDGVLYYKEYQLAVSGIAEYTYANGVRYKGIWKFGKLSGEGTLYLNNGIAVIGNWGTAHRYYCNCTIKYPDGDYFDGNIKINKRFIVSDDTDIYGTFYSKNGDEYSGSFNGLDKKGMLNGSGTKTWLNGSTYAGQWKDGKRHGQGLYTWNDGRLWEGLWEEDEFVSGNKYASIEEKVKLEKEARRKKQLVEAERQIKLQAELKAQRKKEKAALEAKRKRQLVEAERKAKLKAEAEIQKFQGQFSEAKLECEAIGYKEGTEKFGECVLDLTE